MSLPSFVRIFFRNAWNLGLLVLEVEGLLVAEGARIKIDLMAGQIAVLISRNAELVTTVPSSGPARRPAGCHYLA